MLLTNALYKSRKGIARRSKSVGPAWKPRLEYHFACVNDKGHVYIFNGRNGTIRDMEKSDQLLIDWEPFAEAIPAATKARVIKAPKK